MGLQLSHLALKVEYFITIPIMFQGLKDLKYANRDIQDDKSFNCEILSFFENYLE